MIINNSFSSQFRKKKLFYTKTNSIPLFCKQTLNLVTL